MMQRPRLHPIPALLLGLLAALPSPLTAQALKLPQPAAEPPVEPAAEAAPAGGDTAALVRRLDDVSGRLIEINEYLRRPAPDLAGIAVALPDRTAQAEQVLVHLDPVDEIIASAPEAQAALEKMRTLDRIFTKWRGRLQQEVETLDPWREQLRTDATYLRDVAKGNEPAGEDLPVSLRQRLGEAGDEIDATLKPLRKRLDVVVAADVRVGDLQSSLKEMSRKVESAREERQQQPLRLTMPPVWKPPATLNPPLDLVRLNASVLWGAARDYVATQPTQLVLFVLLFGVLLFGVFRLRASILARAPSGEAASGELLVRYPIAVSLLVWTLIGPFLLLPGLPVGLGLVRALVDLAVLWRLLPGLVTTALIPPLRLLLILTAAWILQVALLGDAWYGRAVTLAVGVGALIAFRQIARLTAAGSPADTGAAPKVPWRNSSIQMLARFAPWVVGAGLLAEIFGAGVLGQQAIGGIIFAGLVLCTVLAADGVLRSMLDAFVAGPGARWSRAVRTWPDVVRRNGLFVIRFVLLVLVLNVLPDILPLLGPVWDAVGQLLASPVKLGDVEVSVGAVVWFIAGIVIAVMVARLIRFVLSEDLLPRLPIPMGTASAASRLTYYAVLGGGILLALAASGVELTKLTIVISALGVGIGFGLQNIVKNFVSGLVIAFERPFREGDQIAIGQTTGRVQEIGLRATRIRTVDGAEVIVPNDNFISGEVVNWTLSDRSRRVEIPIGIAYGSDPRRVQQLLLDVLRDVPGIARAPEPAVVFKGFGPSSLDFSLTFWLPDADARVESESEARYRVMEALGREGIDIPFPQIQVHLAPGSTLPGLPTSGGPAAGDPPAR